MGVSVRKVECVNLHGVVTKGNDKDLTTIWWVKISVMISQPNGGT